MNGYFRTTRGTWINPAHIAAVFVDHVDRAVTNLAEAGPRGSRILLANTDSTFGDERTPDDILAALAELDRQAAGLGPPVTYTIDYGDGHTVSYPTEDAYLRAAAEAAAGRRPAADG